MVSLNNDYKVRFLQVTLLEDEVKYLTSVLGYYLLQGNPDPSVSVDVVKNLNEQLGNWVGNTAVSDARTAKTAPFVNENNVSTGVVV